jgi:hypothetical protein
MLRHHEWTSALDHSIRAEAVTVAAMLTPRHDAVRPWDTAVLAILGDQELDPGDVTNLQQLWNRPQATARPHTQSDDAARGGLDAPGFDSGEVQAPDTFQQEHDER